MIMVEMTLDEKVDQIMIDLASVKTDISWLKKLFGTAIGSMVVVGGYAIEIGAI